MPHNNNNIELYNQLAKIEDCMLMQDQFVEISLVRLDLIEEGLFSYKQLEKVRANLKKIKGHPKESIIKDRLIFLTNKSQSASKKERS